MDSEKMMRYQFRWLKYQPDAGTGEFVLMGYIALCLDTQAFAYYMTAHTQRAERFFAGAPANFKTNLRYGLERIRQSLAALAQKNDKWNDLKRLSETVLPENDNAIQWTALQAGIYKDWSETLDFLKRQIEQYVLPSINHSDRSLKQISPRQLKRFAESLGWRSEETPSRFPVYFLSHPDFEYRQLLFPQSAQAPDYLDAMSSCVNKLIAFHGDNLHWYDTETYLYGQIESIDCNNQPVLYLKTDEYGILALEIAQDQLDKSQDRLLQQEVGIHVDLKQNLKGEIKDQRVQFLAWLDYDPDLTRFIDDIEAGKYTPEKAAVSASIQTEIKHTP